MVTPTSYGGYNGLGDYVYQNRSSMMSTLRSEFRRQQQHDDVYIRTLKEMMGAIHRLDTSNGSGGHTRRASKMELRESILGRATKSHDDVHDLYELTAHHYGLLYRWRMEDLKEKKDWHLYLERLLKREFSDERKAAGIAAQGEGGSLLGGAAKLAADAIGGAIGLGFLKRVGQYFKNDTKSNPTGESKSRSKTATEDERPPDKRRSNQRTNDDVNEKANGETRSIRPEESKSPSIRPTDVDTRTPSRTPTRARPKSLTSDVESSVKTATGDAGAIGGDALEATSGLGGVGRTLMTGVDVGTGIATNGILPVLAGVDLANMALNPNEDTHKSFKTAAFRAVRASADGAAVGAAIGSLVPGVGTLVGGAVGGVTAPAAVILNDEKRINTKNAAISAANIRAKGIPVVGGGINPLGDGTHSLLKPSIHTGGSMLDTPSATSSGMIGKATLGGLPEEGSAKDIMNYLLGGGSGFSLSSKKNSNASTDTVNLGNVQNLQVKSIHMFKITPNTQIENMAVEQAMEAPYSKLSRFKPTSSEKRHLRSEHTYKGDVPIPKYAPPSPDKAKNEVDIAKAALKEGVSPATAIAMAGVESNFGRNLGYGTGNSHTGVFQLGPNERRSTGIKSNGSIYQDSVQGLSFVKNTDIRDATKILGHAPKPWQIELLHNQGPAGFRVLATANPNMPAVQAFKNAGLNPNDILDNMPASLKAKYGANITVGEFNDYFKSWMGQEVKQAKADIKNNPQLASLLHHNTQTASAHSDSPPPTSSGVMHTASASQTASMNSSPPSRSHEEKVDPESPRISPKPAGYSGGLIPDIDEPPVWMNDSGLLLVNTGIT